MPEWPKVLKNSEYHSKYNSSRYILWLYDTPELLPDEQSNHYDKYHVLLYVDLLNCFITLLVVYSTFYHIECHVLLLQIFLCRELNLGHIYQYEWSNSSRTTSQKCHSRKVYGGRCASRNCIRCKFCFKTQSHFLNALTTHAKTT